MTINQLYHLYNVQPITDDPHNHTRPGRRVITENIQECICFAVLIGCSVVAVVSFAPLGLVALFLSIIVSVICPV